MKIIDLASKSHEKWRIFGLRMLWVGVRMISRYWQCYFDHFWKIKKFVFSESKIFSVVLLKKDRILALTRISSGSKDFYRKTLKTPIWNLPLSWWQNDENDWTKVNNNIQLAWECHYMIMKDSPRIGKPFGNTNNAFCVAITTQMYDFLLKNHGKSLGFHSFPRQNFPVVSPQPPPCLPQTKII